MLWVYWVTQPIFTWGMIKREVQKTRSKILNNLSVSHLSRKIWKKKKNQAQFYCWLMSLSSWGCRDESDTAKDDEYGNIVSMVVIVVVGYILSMYLKSVVACASCICYLCHIHKMSLEIYTVPLFTVEFLFYPEMLEL